MSSATQNKYEVVIGLEVHLQLNTNTKMFCGCQNQFGSNPNTNVCPVCLGLPGSLPVANKQALKHAIKIGLALNCEINTFVKFDRKNYFYPDCPKNYQISQFDFPICHSGFLLVPQEEGEPKKVNIHRAHLEEDAGKLVHEPDCSLVDYNRTGTPLLEIVTDPDIRSSQEAYDYLQALKLTLQYLNVSDCDMEKGSLRCDANVSIREFGDSKLGTKTELKNMNSFRAVKTALDYEIQRQQIILEAGEKVIQETRLWDESKSATASMRSKEEAHDYRYFPEPDLVPFTIDQSVIDQAKTTLPEPPFKKLERLISEYAISEYDAKIIIQDKDIADFFENSAKACKDTKKICNWINGPIMQELNARKKTIREISLSPQFLSDLIEKVENDIISNLAAKDVLKLVIDTGKSPDEIIQEKGLAQVSDDSALETIINDIINENEKVANQIREGKDSAIGFMVGQAMKKTQGKANPKKVGELIKRRLSNG